MKHTKLAARAGLLLCALGVFALTLGWARPISYAEGPKAVFSAAKTGENPRQTGANGGQNDANQAENPGETAAEGGLRVTYFANLSQPDYARIGRRLEEIAPEENWEITTYYTKNKGVIYENQVKIACSEGNGGVALLCEAGESTADYARRLAAAGYQVVTVNCGENGTENLEIAGILEQNWGKTARLVNEYLRENMTPERSYFLFPDGACAAMEDAFYETLEFGRFYTVYTTNNEDLTRNYALYCFQTRPEMGALICQSSASALAVAEAAEEAQTLAAQGFAREEVKLGALTLDETAMELLEQGRLDFAAGVSEQELFEGIRNILTEISEGKSGIRREMEPILVTAASLEADQ